jgi:DMSO/TMAO reductase YedYZ molybdopterin-dependent catalytic subunit
MKIDRRRVLLRALAMGSIATLPACDYEDPQNPDLADKFLHAMSWWNDRVQQALFNPHTLAPTFRPDQIVNPPRFNAYYDISQVVAVDPAGYRLGLSGQIQDKAGWTLAALNALPQSNQITQLTCVEGWRTIGQWSGVPLGYFLRRVGADMTCKYVSFQCADGYYSSIDMESALHPQTILALNFNGAALTPPFGAPVRLRIPTKLGFKNPKSLTQIAVGNVYTGGYWEDQGYNWFSGS